MKLLLLITSLFLLGCAAPQDERGEIVGTMTIYKTPHGFVVVSDQSGDSMIVDFQITRAVVFEKIETEKQPSK